jgi:hypothetical protein
MRAPPMKQPTAAPAIGTAFDEAVLPVELEGVGGGCWFAEVCLVREVVADSLEVVAVGVTGSSTRGIDVCATCSVVVLDSNIFVVKVPDDVEVLYWTTSVSTVAITLVEYSSVMVGLAPVSVVVT